MQTSSIKWKEEEEDLSFKYEERCLSFFVYLGGSFEKARVLLEKPDGSFDLYHEIKGPFDEWRETRLKVSQHKNQTIWFEAMTSENNQGKEGGAFALDNVANKDYTDDCTVFLVIDEVSQLTLDPGSRLQKTPQIL